MKPLTSANANWPCYFVLHRPWARFVRVLTGVAFCCLLLPTLNAAAPTPKRVLILYSFGRGFTPWGIVASEFQTELARQSNEPIEFHEAALEGPRLMVGEAEEVLVSYLRVLFSDRKPDLVVPCGGPAARFILRKRAELFPGAPLLLAAVEERHLRDFTLDEKTAVVAARFGMRGMIENMLQMCPERTNVVLVVGNSNLERYWQSEMEREFAPFANRVRITWLGQFALPEMEARVGHLTRDSAILYFSVLTDAAGVPYEYNRALSALHERANAPIFGLFEEEVGLGAVGGPVLSLHEQSAQTARVAVQMLSGSSMGTNRVSVIGPDHLVYDSRELQRWGISEQRLPAGSVVRFRTPSFIVVYRRRIFAVACICAVESLLIFTLVRELRRGRKAQRSLQESEERMKLAASAGQMGIWEWNMLTDQIWATGQTAAHISASGAGQSNFDRFLQVVHPDERDQVLDGVKRAILDRGDFGCVHRAYFPDGSLHWMSTRGRVEFDKNRRPVLMRGVWMDVTAQKEAESEAHKSRQELAQVNRSSTLGELAGSLAHELNQPLTSILSNAQALQRFLNSQAPKLQEAREIAADIVSQDRRAGEIIARIRSMLQKRKPDLFLLNLNDCVDEVMSLMGSELLVRKVLVNCRLAADLPPVLGDRIQLQQVWVNLILNASDAMSDNPESERRLTIETAFLPPADVQGSVADTGPGFPSEMIKRAFEPLTTSKNAGLGLGLAICKSSIEAHGGRIWIEECHSGALIRFALPIASKQG